MKRDSSFGPRFRFASSLVLALGLASAMWLAGADDLLSQVALCSTQWISDHLAKPVWHEPDNF